MRCSLFTILMRNAIVAPVLGNGNLKSPKQLVTQEIHPTINE
ncbi:hypothetical protein VTO7225_02366 [Vibrio toranzoniae]|nr:hypothetical protein VTO7225_02366 [Vibrio toranzoniae]